MEKIINKDTATKIVFEKKYEIKKFEDKDTISTMKNPFYEQSQKRKRYVSYLEYKLRNKSEKKRDKIIRKKITQEGNLRLSSYDIININKIFTTILNELLENKINLNDLKRKLYFVPIFDTDNVNLVYYMLYDSLLIENNLSIIKQIDNEEIVYLNEKFFYNRNSRKYKEFFPKGDEYYVMKLYSGTTVYYEKRLSKEEYLKEKEYFIEKDKYIVEKCEE